MEKLFKDNNKGALLSECGNYRYKLWRIWDVSKPKVLFVMLNPSKADALQDDPTIRRCIDFAKRWGYGGIMVGNIFPHRATNPKDLLHLTGTDESKKHSLINKEHVFAMANECEKVVYAYGNPPVDFKIINTELPGCCLGTTSKGNPKHPLYLKKDTPLRTFTQ